MPGIDDMIPGSNAGAYEKEEIRVGPPLSYVGEKLRMTVECVYESCRKLKAAKESAVGCRKQAISIDGQDLDAAWRFAVSAFRYSLTAFLALYNMLGLLADQSLCDTLLQYERKEFEQWLDRIEQEGSVTG